MIERLANVWLSMRGQYLLEVGLGLKAVEPMDR